MATSRDRNIYDMFVRTLAFDAEHSADYATIALAAENFAIVQAAKDALDTYFADQTSGARSAAVELQGTLVAAIRRKMARYSKTAKAINLSSPGFGDLFTLPKGQSLDALIASGREFVKQAGLNATALAGLGITNSLKTTLTSDLDALEGTITDKGSAQADTVAATAGIENQIDNGMKAEKVLDAIMSNVYDTDPVTHAEWRTARHVKRANQTDDSNNDNGGGQPI